MCDPDNRPKQGITPAVQTKYFKLQRKPSNIMGVCLIAKQIVAPQQSACRFLDCVLLTHSAVCIMHWVACRIVCWDSWEDQAGRQCCGQALVLGCM